MPRTPDRTPGPRFEEELVLDDRGPGGDNTGDSSQEGGIRRVTNALRVFLGGTVRQILQVKSPPADFEDIDLTGITNGQGLAYNSTSRQFEPQTFSGGGLDETTHRALDQLVHDIAEDSFEEIIRNGFLVSDVITWTDAGKTVKIREQNITYTGFNPTQIVNTQYDATGTAVEIVIENITYSGFLVDSITRTRTL